MVKKLSNKFISSIGSVINILPDRKYRLKSYLPEGSTADRLSRDWMTIGRDMQKVFSAQSDDIKKQRKNFI